MIDSPPRTPRNPATVAASPGRVRDVALRLYSTCRADWAWAEVAVPRIFREASYLHSQERRFIAEAIYGLFRNDRRVWFLLNRVAGEIPERVADLAGWLAWLVMNEGLLPEVAAREWHYAETPVRIDFFRLAHPREELEKWEKQAHPTPLQKLAVESSLPDWLARDLLGDFGFSEATAMMEAMNRRAPMTVHTNANKLTRAELITRLAEEGVTAHASSLSAGGVAFDTKANVFALASYKEGLFWMQDEGSQLIAEAVAPPPGGKVVDACAGAGGKTLALASLLKNRGRILSLDMREHALEDLRKRARRAGVTNNEAVAIPPDGPLPDSLTRWMGKADRVLVDAPCSGTGVLRRNPERRWRLTEEEVRAFPERQAAILTRMAPLVAPGGRLIYATCSLLKAENDGVVARFLSENNDFSPVPLKEILSREVAESRGDGQVLRVLPHLHDTDGFYAAVMRRRSKRHAPALPAGAPGAVTLPSQEGEPPTRSEDSGGEGSSLKV